MKDKVKSIKVTGKKVIFEIELKVSDFSNKGWGEYYLDSQIKDQILKTISNYIFEKHGERIIKDVLKDVNWPDIVRSKIAQKVIASAGKENWE